MRRQKIVAIVGGGVAAVAALLAVFIGVALLHESHRWPFSTGTLVPAFWGATFEMSSAEVSRATGLSLKLTPPEDKNNFQDFLWGSFTYSDPEIESLTSRRYAGDVSLFETSGNLLFEFLEERLIGIDGAFHPWPSERTKFVENLSKALTTRFGTPPKKD